MDLIYCADGNPKLSQIAYDEGWKLGFRSDKWMADFPITFIDVNYKKPDFKKHVEIVAKHRPRYATIPDLSETEINLSDIDRAIDQYKILAEYCEIPLIVPKLSGQIALLPPYIAIGYSIPSSYGGAQFPLWELAGKHIHLLGGSPRKQIQTYLHLSPIAEVVSLDGNYAQKQATKFAEYWEKNKWVKHPRVKAKEKDLYLECWRLSCKNIMQEWQKILGRNQ